MNCKFCNKPTIKIGNCSYECNFHKDTKVHFMGENHTITSYSISTIDKLVLIIFVDTFIYRETFIDCHGKPNISFKYILPNITPENFIQKIKTVLTFS